MLICPACRKRLDRKKTENGIIFECSRCHGRAIGFPVVKKVADAETVKKLWKQVVSSEDKTGVDCPVCDQSMKEVAIPLVGNEKAELDVCKSCRFLWFDPKEFESLPPQKPKADPYKDLPQKAREQMAIAEAQSLADRERGEDFGSDAPEESWKWIPALMGMPVEQEVHEVSSWPWITWGVIALTLLVWMITGSDINEVAKNYGLIPAEASRYFGLTFLTSFLLHGSLIHIIGNMYFLFVFGDNTEDYLGHTRYFLLLLFSMLAGDLLHILADPRSEIPVIGASGGISGVLVFYALQFPKSRMGYLFRFWYIFRWIYVPAWFSLICWFLLQFFMAYQQIAGSSHVSALAHLGGAFVGVIAWLIWRNSRLT